MLEVHSHAEQVQAVPEITQKRHSSLKYELVLVLASIIWGATFLVTKNTLRLIGPFTYLGLCYSVATLTLIVIFHKRLLHVTRRELLLGSVIGVVLFAGYAFQTIALQWTIVSTAGFITGMYVPLVPLLTFLFLRQRIAQASLWGAGLSVLGLLLLSLKEGFSLSFGRGELLLLCAAFSFALQVLLVGRFAPTLDAINLAIIQIAVTALLSLFGVPLAGEPLAAPPLAVWLPVLLLGTIDMAFTLLAMNWVQQFISSTRAVLIYSLEPMWAALFGILFAGDVLHLLAWLGCGCIFLGMIIGRIGKISLPGHKSTR